MSQENSNAQTAAANQSPVPPTGPTSEELQARIAELEKQSEGRLRDLQDERRRRQEVEQRYTQPAPAPSAAPQNDVTQDELYKVVAPVIEKHPLVRQAQEATKFAEVYYQDKALDYLASQMGKKREEILADTKLQERFASTARKWGVSGNMYDATVRVYELMQLEDLRSKEQERTRQAMASQATSMPSGTPPAPASSQREYSVSEFNAMSLSDFDEMSSKGSFKKIDNKFVYIPRQ